MSAIKITTITRFKIIKPIEAFEQIGDELVLDIDGSYHPDKKIISLRAYNFIYLLMNPHNYKIYKLKIENKDVVIPDEHLNYTFRPV